MKIKNKLLLVNLVIFSLFLATFILFYASVNKLMNMKDLEKETMQLRNMILRLEYANNAILKSPSLPIYNLKLTYEELTKELDSINNHKNLKYLDEKTTDRIADVYRFLQTRDFTEYYDRLSTTVALINPQMGDASLDMIYQDWVNGVPIDSKFYGNVLNLRFTVNEFSNWYIPFSEQFRIISGEILETINEHITNVVLQTGIMMILSFALSISIILFIYRKMIQNLKDVRNGIQLISSGNLRTRIPVSSKDELATMGENFNNLTETIWQRLNTIGSIIHNIGQSLTENPDSAHLEKTLLQLSIENTKADNGAFYKPDKERRVLVSHHTTDHFAFPYDESVYRGDIPYGKTIIGMAAVSGEPYFVKEPTGQNLLPHRTSFDRHYISSCIVLPLISEKEIVGIICLEKNDDKERFRDLDYSNILSFIEFSAVTLRNLEKYTELLRSTGLNREMQIASDIQKSLLPPKIPKVPRFDISVNTYSVKGISGDIYDFFPVDHGKWLFCMAEVLEKGIASSMMLVILRTLIRILVRSGQDPAELMTILLENFTETTGMATAVRINLCLMEPGEKKFTYCGTEDQHLLVYKKKSDKLNLVEAKIRQEGTCQSVKGSLEENDFLIMMTDGFYNAVNAVGKAYGWNPIMKIIKKYNQRSSSWLQDAIVKDITFFEREVEQADDRTLFVAGFKESR